ncbi:MAG: butyrate kinase [Clostridia bacterium]|nr:butyrate kinase [Clostridia bacterium]
MSEAKKILVINMGSTSSKLAYFEDSKKVYEKSYEHPASELTALETVEAKCDYRRPLVEDFIKENGIDMTKLDAIAARGCGDASKNYRTGAYKINAEVAEGCKRTMGHQGLLTSTVIGQELSEKYGVPAYLYDVVPVNEFPEIAKYTGLPFIKRDGGSHTLNTRARAIEVAKDLGMDYKDGNFIVAHMGGGISINVHDHGRMVDATVGGEGSFSPDRAGAIPSNALRALCYSGKYTSKELSRMMGGHGGLIAYLGTNNCKEIEERISAGDAHAEEVYHAMAYQISKVIGSLAVPVKGKVDAIILTGGIAYSKLFTGWIKDYVGFIGPVVIKPGAIEVEALAGGVLRVLNGEEQVNSYEEVLKTKKTEG